MSAPKRIGPYQLGDCLGRGGMGVVYRATRPDLPREVALKVVLPAAATPATLERFWREAQALARVNHPRVVRIHELQAEAGTPYLVEELIEGELLAEVCADGLPPARAARILERLADALSAVHAAGVLHRDLKPSNVLLRAGDDPVLLDFGLARAVDAERLTLTGDLLGTPAYMAPEQARGGSAGIDERTDVYQLGALGLHLLTGEPPYAGPVYQVVAAILNGDPPAWPETDPELLAILRRAMAPAPAERFPSAAALRDALAAYAEGEPAPARSRAPLLAGVALAGLATLAAGALALRPPPASPPASARASSSPPPASTGESAAPAPGPTPVWELAPGATLTFATWVEDTAPNSLIRMTLTHRATVRPAAAGRVRWEAEVRAVELRIDVTASDALDQTYSSRDPKPNPFAILGTAVGKRWSLTLEPRAGGVEQVRGLEGILKQVEKLPADVLVGPQQRKEYATTCRRILNDAFIRGHLSSLLQLRGGDALRWKPADDRLRTSARAAPLLLPFPRSGKFDRDHRFNVRGIARTEPGRVLRSELWQEQPRPAPPKGGEYRLHWGFALIP